jgi:hypothetical protein
VAKRNPNERILESITRTPDFVLSTKSGIYIPNMAPLATPA